MRTWAYRFTSCIVSFAFFEYLASKCIPIISNKTTPRKSIPTRCADLFQRCLGWKREICEGEVIASDITFTTDLQNQCLVMREREKQPNTFQFIGLWSMDSLSGNLVMLLASNHNSGARVFRSHGWQSGAKSSAVFDATYEFSKDDGSTWQVGDRQVYTKVSSQ